MFKYRAISFPLLLALFGAMIFWKQGGWYLFTVFCCAVTFGLAWDICSMLAKNEVKSFRLITAIMTALFFASVVFSCASAFLSLTVFAVFCVWGGLLKAENKLDFFKRGITSAGVLGFILLTFSPLLLIYMYYDPMWFMFMVLVTKSMDTGGYIAGMLTAKFMKNGNHKILPKISPKKSWEGFFGGIALSVLVSLCFYWCKALPGNILWFIGVAVVLAIGSFAGDLTESALKRACDVKDSGNYIPGMGGAFDVLDSFIYNGMLFCLFLLI